MSNQFIVPTEAQIVSLKNDMLQMITQLDELLYQTQSIRKIYQDVGLTPEQVASIICQSQNFPYKELKSKRRDRSHSEIRQLIAYFLYKFFYRRYSVKRLTKVIYGDHSSFLHGKDRAEEFISVNDTLFMQRYNTADAALKAFIQNK